MMRGYTQAQVAEAFRHLGVTPGDLMGIRSSKSLPEAQGRLKALQERVKKRWKQLAFELHPDRTQGDKVKEQLFKLLAGVVNKIEEAKIQPPRPRMRPMAVRFVQQPIYTSTSSSTSTSTWGSWVPGGFGTQQVWVNGRRVA
jgi:hypothetical protein